MSKEERFELSCCLFNESDMDFIRDKKTNEEYVVLDELVPILNQQDTKIADLEAKLAESERQYQEYRQVVEKDIEKEIDERIRDTIKEFNLDISQLKQQLAEKEEKLNSNWYKLCERCGNPYGASQFPSKDENGKEIYVCSNCNEKELFYEPLIKQLEDQNDRLIKERDDANLKLTEKEKEIEQLKKFDDLNKTFFDLFRTAFKEPNKVDDLFNTLKTMQEKQDQDKISFCIKQLEKIKEMVKPYLRFDWNLYLQICEKIDNQIKLLKEGDK